MAVESFSSTVITVVLLTFQGIGTILGTVIMLMIKRLLNTVDNLVLEDKRTLDVVHAHREDTLKRFHDMTVEIMSRDQRRHRYADRED